MVEKIWEGTTNVCGLDLTRAVTKNPDSVNYYLGVSIRSPDHLTYAYRWM